MQTLQVVVTRRHRVSMEHIAEVGEILDLPENVAIERITTNAVRLATPEDIPAVASTDGAAEGAALDAAAPGAGVADSEGSGDTTDEATASSVAVAAPADPPAADATSASEPPAPETKTTPPAPARSGRRNAN